MNSKASIIQQLKQQKLLPLFYHDDISVCLGATKALYAAGFRLIEYTNRGKAALENFKALVSARNAIMQDLLLAAGTIKTAEQGKQFLDAGADFLISPVFDADICEVANLQNKLWIPGCMTPTEIHTAEMAGCTFVKLFPGNLLGPSYVSAVKELFPTVDLMPTGGVEAEKDNLEAWFGAGACTVGMGSKLVTKILLDTKDYTTLENRSRKALELANSLST